MTPAERARIDAGYGGKDGLRRAAKKLRFSERYIRKVERKGRGSDYYCIRAGRLFDCPADWFFFPSAYWGTGATAAQAAGGADTKHRAACRKSTFRR